MIDAPQFPDGREILFEDKNEFDSIFKKTQPEISAYTFTNIFAWRRPYNTKISTLDGFIIVSYNINGTRTLLEPLGDGNKADVIKKCHILSEDLSASFKCISHDIAESLPKDHHLKASLDRDNSDYLYNANDLIELPGRKYDAKRNFINRLKSNFTYEYIEITPENVMQCHEFAQQWCEDRSCDTSEGLARERCAVYEMLTHFEQLGICGGAISIAGRIVAFSLGEALNPQTLVVHVEKADTAVEGIYQLINNEFCIHAAQDFEFVNREQDLGIPGLRKAKESYHPVKIVKTYSIKPHHAHS